MMCNVGKRPSCHVQHKGSDQPAQMCKLVKAFLVCKLQGSYMSGKYQGNFFFMIRELSGNSMMCQGEKKICKNIRKMSGNFTFQPYEARMFGPDVSFLLNS